MKSVRIYFTPDGIFFIPPEKKTGLLESGNIFKTAVSVGKFMELFSVFICEETRL